MRLQTQVDPCWLQGFSWTNPSLWFLHAKQCTRIPESFNKQNTVYLSSAYTTSTQTKVWQTDRQTDKQTIYAELQPSTPLLLHLNTTIHNCWMHSWFNSMHACFFFLSSVDLFFLLISKLTFSNKTSVIPSGSQTVWIQIRPNSMHQILQREAIYCKNSYIYSLTFNLKLKLILSNFRVQYEVACRVCFSSFDNPFHHDKQPWTYPKINSDADLTLRVITSSLLC